MVIKWTKPALSDLNNFKSISKKNNVSKYIKKLFEYSHQLADNPELGHPYKYFRKVIVRKLVYEEHSIFYIIDKKNNIIYILAVVHHRQDINKKLNAIATFLKKNIKN